MTVKEIFLPPRRGHEVKKIKSFKSDKLSDIADKFIEGGTSGNAHKLDKV